MAGVSPPPGAVLVLHSLPLEFPLAMAFAEQLLTWKLGESNERSEDELDTVPSSVLLQVVELLGRSNDSQMSLIHAGVKSFSTITQQAQKWILPVKLKLFV